MSKFNMHDKVRVIGVPISDPSYDVGIIIGQLANETVLVDWTTADERMREQESELERVPSRGPSGVGRQKKR